MNNNILLIIITLIFISGCKKENIGHFTSIENPYNFEELKKSNFPILSPSHYVIKNDFQNLDIQSFLSINDIFSIENNIVLSTEQYEKLSKTIRCEVLDKLYIPENTNEEKALANHYKTSATEASGLIEVYDPISKNYAPLKNLRIHLVDGLRTYSTFTDENGRFSMSKFFYTNHIDVYVHFKNKTLDIRVLDADHLEQAFFPLLKKIGSYSQNNLGNIHASFGGNIATDTSHQVAYAATSWYNYFLYRNFASTEGYILPQNKNISIWIAKDALLSTSYAAPMLNQLSNTTYPKKLLNELFHLPASMSGVIAQLLRYSLPDIYAPYYSERYPGEGFMLSLFHEFSHAVHYSKAGDEFWYKYISYIYSNTGYGDGNSTERGRVGLSEAWAEDLSMQCAQKLYGSDSYSDTLLDNNTSSATWIPWGVYYDLYDGENSGEIWDSVQHFTFPQIYNMFSPSLDDISKLKIQLKATYDQMPYLDAKIDTLFAHYSW